MDLDLPLSTMKAETNWVRYLPSLNSIINNLPTKDYQYALSQILTLKLQDINWDEWQNEIHTAGVVGKIRTKYENFMRAEYNVEAAVGQVGH